ncbi:MAG: hypothetical protein GQ565_12285 [Candidatus Aegiribacteria sp.]|nr:hypothetical protein [Candidatus Aegiribacteria sp.]
MILRTLCILIVIILCSCAEPHENNKDSIVSDSLSIILREWKEWSERTDEGLWEDDSEHKVTLEMLQVYGGSEAIDPPFYYIESFAVKGDTIFVSDRSTERLVAFDLDNQVLWTTEGFGEGPGHFSGISQLDVYNDVIAVANMGNGRVDIFSTDGKWSQSIQVISPYDLEILNDSVLIVVKQTSPEGCVMLLNMNGDTLSTFGAWEDHLEGFSANRDLHCTMVDSEHLVINSYYTNRMEIYSLYTNCMISSFNRTLPVEIPEPQSENGMISLNTFLLDIFIGPEGMINVLLRPFTPDKSIDTMTEDIVNLSIVDRFNHQGQYLDSYVIPVSTSQVIYSNGILYAGSALECAIYSFNVMIGER